MTNLGSRAPCALELPGGSGSPKPLPAPAYVCLGESLRRNEIQKEKTRNRKEKSPGGSWSHGPGSPCHTPSQALLCKQSPLSMAKPGAQPPPRYRPHFWAPQTRLPDARPLHPPKASVFPSMKWGTGNTHAPQVRED